MSQKVKVLQNDILMYQNLLQANEAGLHKVMHKFLKGKYNTIIHTKEYTIAVGDIPIALVAHMDTVFKFPPTTDMLYFDQEKHVMWSPNGCGHDDRAGIFAIIQIINMGLRPSVILTTGEEQGGIGAMAIVEDYPACPIKDLKFMIELDRQGEDDCVFYQCANENFFKYIKKFGFIKRKGSYSDISFLMSMWEICGVNLSVGYFDEHTYAEYLNYDYLWNTIHKVVNILKQDNIPNFKYKEVRFNKQDAYVPCDKCQTLTSLKNAFKVKLPENGFEYRCCNCIADPMIMFCGHCGDPFIGGSDEFYCETCLAEKESVINFVF